MTAFASQAPPPAPSARGSVVHLVDLTEPPDGLMRVAVGAGETVVRRRLDGLGQRVRAAAELAWHRPARVIAWGRRAGEVAAAVPGLRAIVRLPGHATRPVRAPGRGQIVVAHDPRQAAALRAGLAGQVRVEAIPSPVWLAEGVPARRAVGASPEDYLWLLPAALTRSAGLREALWVVVLMHIMERRRQMHKALLVGDGEPQRAAVRFVNNLGLPELLTWLPAERYEAVAGLADAGISVPIGQADPWSEGVMVSRGLPVVTNTLGSKGVALAGREGVWVAPTDRPRVILKQMLEVAESGTSPRPPAVPPAFSAETIRQRWEALCRAD